MLRLSDDLSHICTKNSKFLLNCIPVPRRSRVDCPSSLNLWWDRTHLCVCTHLPLVGSIPAISVAIYSASRGLVAKAQIANTSHSVEAAVFDQLAIVDLGICITVEKMQH